MVYIDFGDIDAESSNLAGVLIGEILQLQNLKGLSLARNNISGSIPTQIGSLTYLEEIFLGEKFLTGIILGTLGGLKNIQNFSVWGKQSFRTYPR